MTGLSASLAALQKRIWTGALPLEIRLSTEDSNSDAASKVFLISLPRLSYLPPVLNRLHAFFLPDLSDPSISPHEGWLSFSGLPLKWHYPIGLLYDLFSGADPIGLPHQHQTLPLGTHPSAPGFAPPNDHLPWCLTLHYTSHPSSLIFPLDPSGAVPRDAFTNAVKEADFVRTGSAKNVMSLSKPDADALWAAVQTHDLDLFRSVSDKLLNPPGQAQRHVPIKVYLPTQVPAGAGQGVVAAETASGGEVAAAAAGAATVAGRGEEEAGGQVVTAVAGSVRVVQGLIRPEERNGRTKVTLGAALSELLPSVFPSRRIPVLACPVLHGAVVPMAAVLQDLGRAATYCDGWLHISVALLG